MVGLLPIPESSLLRLFFEFVKPGSVLSKFMTFVNNFSAFIIMFQQIFLFAKNVLIKNYIHRELLPLCVFFLQPD